MHRYLPKFSLPPTRIDLHQRLYFKFSPFPKVVLYPQVKKEYVQHIVRADRYRGPRPARSISGNRNPFFTPIEAAAQLRR